MRLLVDGNLSPQVADHLTAAGHEAVHIRRYGLQSADDPTVFGRAAIDRRILVTDDTHAPLSWAEAVPALPSCICVRSADPRSPAEQAALVAAQLAAVGPELEAGAILVLADGQARLRRYPLNPG